MARVVNIKNGSIYQQEQLVLNNVNLQIKEGEFAYLIGKTGSGKSSLLKVLYGDLPLVEGEGQVVGFDVTMLKGRQVPDLRRKLGIVFQDFQLLTDRSVAGNLDFVLRATGWDSKSERNERIDEVLLSVKMMHKKDSMPYRLSGGEQQRIAISRALLNYPRLILADEPTGNLDPETSAEIMELIRDVSERRNCSVLMATHDYALIQQFPARTIRVEEETLVESDQKEMLF